MERCKCEKSINAVSGAFKCENKRMIELYAFRENKDSIYFYARGDDVLGYLHTISVSNISCCKCDQLLFNTEEISCMRDIVKYSTDFNGDLIRYLKILYPTTTTKSETIQEIFDGIRI